MLHVSVNKATFIQKKGQSEENLYSAAHVCFSVIFDVWHVRHLHRVWCTLCNPGHLLQPGKLFPPTRLSVGSSHSRLPYSYSLSMNRSWNKPPTVQNVFLSYVLAQIITGWVFMFVSMHGRVWKEVNFLTNLAVKWAESVCHSVLFRPMALPQSNINEFI